MKPEELNRRIDEAVKEAVASVTKEFTKIVERLERRVEGLSTDIKILKEGGNL